MIKQTIHKSFSFLMALLVLLSTVSFTVEKHFCGDVLIDTAVFTEVQKCAMEAFEIEQEAITKIPCCKDVIDFVEGQDELNVNTFDDLYFEQQQFISSVLFSFTSLYEDVQKEIIPHKDYSPPNLIFDIQILDQVFII